MPIRNKSFGQQISNPRETYIDGYGTQREVYEPEYVTKGRDIYNKGRDVYQTVHSGFNPGENLQLTNPETGESYKVNANSGAGILMDVIDPAGVIGKVDDVAKFAKNLDSVKDRWDGLRRFQLRRRVNKTPGAQKALERNIRNKELDDGSAYIEEYPEAINAFASDYELGVASKLSEKIKGDPYKRQELQLDRIAKEYNAALKAGNTQLASDLKHRAAKIVRQQYYDPYVNNHFGEEVNTRLFDTRNGGPGLTPRERQTLLLDIENPG